MDDAGRRDCITDVPGVTVGHAQSDDVITGCTVVLLENGAIAGVDIGGSAPGTRDTELLNPTNMVFHVHAVLLTGGSTFGLNAAGGVQQFLRERDIGFHSSGGAVVPIVPPQASQFISPNCEPRIGLTDGTDSEALACASALMPNTSTSQVSGSVGSPRKRSVLTTPPVRQ